MTFKSWKQVAVATLLAAGTVGCSNNGGLLRRFGMYNESGECHYGCCDSIDGGYADGYGDGGCMGCDHIPDLRPIGPFGDGFSGQGAFEEVPSSPFSPEPAGPRPISPSGPAGGPQPIPVLPGPGE